MKIDQEASHSYVVEDLDDQHVVVVEERLPQLKAKLDEVRTRSTLLYILRWEGERESGRLLLLSHSWT